MKSFYDFEAELRQNRLLFELLDDPHNLRKLMDVDPRPDINQMKNGTNALNTESLDANWQFHLRSGSNRFRNGTTPLIAATFFSQSESVKILLEAKADVNMKDAYGDTALISAAKNRKIKSVNILLEAKADVNTKDAYGKTAFIYAVMNGRYEDSTLFQRLIDAKSDINIIDNAGANALMYAVLIDHYKVVKPLIEMRANLNQRSNEYLPYYDKYINRHNTDDLGDRSMPPGSTALIMATKSSRDCVKWLLDAKADPKIKDDMGNAAYDYTPHFSDIRALLCKVDPHPSFFATHFERQREDKPQEMNQASQAPPCVIL